MSRETPAQSELSLQESTFADCQVVAVAGRVDHTNAELFRTRLERCAGQVPDGGGLVVALDGLDFITSAGLRALLLSHRELGKRKATMHVTGVRGVVKEVFGISKFDSLLSMAEDTGAAVAAVSPEAAKAYSG